MKIAIIILSLSFISTSQAECEITLKAAKANSKSAKIATVNFGAKQIAALRSICHVTIRPLTKAEKIAAYKAKLDDEEIDFAIEGYPGKDN